MADKKPASRRSLKGLLINPSEQLRLSFWIGGGCLVVTMVVLGVLMVALNMKISSLAETYAMDPEMTYSLQQSLTIMILIATGIIALMTVFSIGAGIGMTHRIFGPIVPIMRHVQALTGGNYQSRVRLRKGDAHVELSDALNKLAQALEEKK